MKPKYGKVNARNAAGNTTLLKPTCATYCPFSAFTLYAEPVICITGYAFRALRFASQRVDPLEKDMT